MERSASSSRLLPQALGQRGAGLEIAGVVLEQLDGPGQTAQEAVAVLALRT